MAKGKEETIKLEVTIQEKAILQVAVQRHFNELEKVLKKCRELGVEVTKATQIDIEAVEVLAKKLDGQEPLKM